MLRVYCSIEERKVNPLFEVFDGGDFTLSSWRDIEAPLTEVGIYFEEAGRLEEARAALGAALALVGEADAEIRESQVADEDWRFSYRRHFKTEHIGSRLTVRPPWEELTPESESRKVITLDPGLAFGTGRHETTRACLEYIDELSEEGGSMIDMGSGSGILSIAASLLGFAPVEGFDVDPEAVEVARENATLNAANVRYCHFALGARGGAKTVEAPSKEPFDLVVANILGPLLIRFAPEIAPYAKRHLVVSGILNEIYPEVLAAYEALGFREVTKRVLGEWTTGLLVRDPATERGKHDAR